MEAPNLIQLNNLRKEGYRPGVIICILYEKKLLMFYKKEYKLWQLPQGGINNKEEPRDVLEREIREEVNPQFVANLDFNTITYLEEDRMDFKPGRHEIDQLLDDDGFEIKMIGKHYFFYAVQALKPELDIVTTQFDQHFWLTFKEATFLAEHMYQRGKKRITLKILNILFEKGLIV